MPTDAPFIPPKKKPSIFWWLGGAFIILIFIFILQLFGPSPRIYVSPQTTYITDPLGADGLPDYEQHILNVYRDGVTPADNAASLLWPALWPGELSPADYAAVAAELGLDHIPAKSETLVPIFKRISTLMNEKYAAADREPAGNDSNIELETDQLFNLVMQQPWTTEQLPALGKWARDNQKPLDQLIAGSRRPRCYFPSPSLLDKKRESLIMMLLPGAQGVRESGRSLRARAMWHLGEQRPMEAWQDLLAAHRIGRLTAQGLTMVEQLVGMAISNMACEGTVTLLHDGNLNAEQARQIMGDLSKLEYFSGMADSIDTTERAAFLDATILTSEGKLTEQELGSVRPDIESMKYVAIDWNIVLKKGNKYYDRYAAAARLPTHPAREQAMAQVHNDLSRLSRSFDAKSAVAAVLSPAARSEAAATIMVQLLLPAMDAAFTAQDRENTRLDLTRLAAALAVYRAEQGEYPAKLEDLIPGVLDKLPVDLYNAKPFIYKRIDTGYLLYSIGANGQDDHGSSERLQKFEGVDAKDDNSGAPSQPSAAQIPSNSDDLSIRVPAPPLPLPGVGSLQPTPHSEK